MTLICVANPKPARTPTKNITWIPASQTMGHKATWNKIPQWVSQKTSGNEKGFWWCNEPKLIKTKHVTNLRCVRQHWPKLHFMFSLQPWFWRHNMHTLHALAIAQCNTNKQFLKALCQSQNIVLGTAALSLYIQSLLFLQKLNGLITENKDNISYYHPSELSY